MRIETKRLVIRPFVPTDLPAFEKLLEIPEVPGWQRQRPRSAEFLQWQIGNYATMDIVHGIVCLGVFDRASAELYGAIGAGEHDDLHETEICYNLLPAARGHGYATEACRALSAWVLAEYDLPYLIGTAAVDNLRSQRVLERSGYTFVDERELLVHLLDERHVFRYYRRYH